MINESRPIKQQKLDAALAQMGRVCIAYSGGVDSTYLLSRAVHSLPKQNVFAVIAVTDFLQAKELQNAKDICASFGVNLNVLELDVLSNADISQNNPDRCYYCKHLIFESILDFAKSINACVIDGTNADDICDYRPGIKALSELGITSPLLNAQITKDDIRALLRDAGISTWKKPQSACLASRVAYGQRLKAETLRKINMAESLLHDLGFLQCRVRVHEGLARIEVEERDIERVAQDEIRQIISKEFSHLGFSYVALDLRGYRTGSLNEVLSSDISLKEGSLKEGF